MMSKENRLPSRSSKIYLPRHKFTSLQECYDAAPFILKIIMTITTSLIVFLIHERACIVCTFLKRYIYISESKRN